MSCICAKITDEYHGYECEITGGACSYLRPNQDACADMYGEVEHTPKWEAEHKKKKFEIRTAVDDQLKYSSDDENFIRKKLQELNLHVGGHYIKENKEGGNSNAPD